MLQSRIDPIRIGLRTATAVILIGLCAGVINGLLGAGGGIIAVLALTAWQRSAGEQSPQAAKDVYATSLLAMLPVSLLSVTRYAARGHLDASAFTPYLLPAIAGGLLGGWVLDRVRLPFLKRLFAVLLLISGARMLLR